MRHRCLAAVCVMAAAIALQPRLGCARVIRQEMGTWPADWPKELEPFRKQAHTLQVGAGIQQTVYEIRFENREEFERLWPVLLKLKTKGAPLTLYSAGANPPAEWGGLIINLAPTVRIYAPSRARIRPATGKSATTQAADRPTTVEPEPLRAAPPWPKNIVLPGGGLPEYVRPREAGGKLAWSAMTPEESSAAAKVPLTGPPPGATPGQITPGVIYRARIDLDLVVDGKVIDPARISLPPKSQIIDKRESKEPKKEPQESKK